MTTTHPAPEPELFYDPTFESLIAATEDMVRDLNYQIASGEGDTAALSRFVRHQEEQLRRLRLMRVQFSPNPKEPLP